MKNVMKVVAKGVAAVSKKAAEMAAGSASWAGSYQAKEPKQLKK